MSDMTTPPPETPAAPPPKVKREKPKSRSQRWADAAGDALDAINEIESKLSDLEDALSELRSVQEEYEEWKDNNPENLANSALGEKLEAVCSLEIESAAEGIRSAVDEANSTISEAEGIDLPLGFGRD